jgi:hypothetical protein
MLKYLFYVLNKINAILHQAIFKFRSVAKYFLRRIWCWKNRSVQENSAIHRSSNRQQATGGVGERKTSPVDPTAGGIWKRKNCAQ